MPQYNISYLGDPSCVPMTSGIRRSISSVIAATASPAEQAYIKALSKRYSSDPAADPKKLAADYRAAMAELVKEYPDDLDAATLYAESMMNLRPWQLWTLDGKPAINKAGYINHSCRPNCEPIVHKARVYVFARRAIKPGEELTYDYGKEYFDEYLKGKCRCEKCAGA